MIRSTTPRLRRFGGDVLASAGVIAIVIAVLVSFDVRVREQAQAAIRAASPSGVGNARGLLGDIATTMLDALRTQSIEHAPLLIFVVVGTVLLLCMVRT